MNPLDHRDGPTAVTAGTARPALLSISEAPGLFADAVLTDEAQNLLFLSVWGRDSTLR